jgi:hypothetical protein
VAVVLAPVQTKQIRISIHKRNNTKHSTNNTKYSKYKYTYYQNTHTYTHPPVAYPGIFFGGGVQQIQLRTEGREKRDLGAVAP